MVNIPFLLTPLDANGLSPAEYPLNKYGGRFFGLSAGNGQNEFFRCDASFWQAIAASRPIWIQCQDAPNKYQT